MRMFHIQAIITLPKTEITRKEMVYFMLVYVLNSKGNPIMPCSPAKARKLLKEGSAKIVKRDIFTIQLIYGSSGYKQKITLGVDTGSVTVGLSATTKERELFAGEYKLRNDISDLLSDRRMYRRSRRNRKTRYRKARFLNRVRTKNKGWLAPSVEHKIESHINIIGKLHKILPIKKIVLELANFDIQRINNPDIKGKGYQLGEAYGFENIKSYILFRDNYTCQHCKGKSKDSKLHVHHIVFRSQGGSDNASNLVCLCKLCHDKLHQGKIELNLKGNKKKHKDSTFMNIMKNTLFNRIEKMYSNVEMTYGYITKQNRYINSIDKTHRLDALAISGNFKAKPLDYVFYMKKVRCQNRQIHKAKILKGGIKKLNQAKYEVLGFRLFDKVLFEGKEYFIFGRRNSGFFDIRDLEGNKVNKGSIGYKKLKLALPRKNILIERREGNSSATLKG